MNLFRRLAVSVVFAAALFGQSAGTIVTVAGNGTAGFSGDGGQATNARITGPGDSVAIDNNGNLLISDYNRIRRVNPAGIISTIAGGGASLGEGVQATSAYLFTNGVCTDSAGNVYVSGGTTVRKINTSGVINTIAGNPANFTYSGDNGPALSAGFMATNITIDGAGNLYIADTLDQRVRKINSAGIITTIAGNGTQGFSGDGGPATSAKLALPQGIAADSAGNVYIADSLNQRIRKVDTSGTITTVASGLLSPLWVAVDNSGNLYIADPGSNAVKKVDTTGKLTTFAGGAGLGFSGDGGPATSARMFMPNSVAVDGAGNVYVLDSDNFRVRKIAGSGGSGGTGGTGGTGSTPVVAAAVNGASFGNGLVSNSYGTITGTNLSPVTDTWNNAIVNGKLPTSLDGVSVTVGFAPAYLAYVSQTQINFVVPPNLTGSVPVTVTTPSGTSTTFNTTASTFAPAFFPWPNNQVVATHLDYSLAAKNGSFGVATTPAAPGEVLVLWGTGFGPTIPAGPTGVQAPALANGLTYATASTVLVTINNVPATVYGAAVAVGYAGLYQVAIQVPSSLLNGDWPIVASIGGVASPAGAVLSVHN